MKTRSYVVSSRVRGFTLVEVIIMIGIVLIFVILAIGALSKGSMGMNIKHGDGEKVGQIVRLDKKGLFVKTWEAQLIRGGMTDGSGTIGSTPFDFTVENPDTVKRVMEYLRNQTEVSIKYNIEGVYSPFRSESRGNFLTSIEPAKKKR